MDENNAVVLAQENQVTLKTVMYDFYNVNLGYVKSAFYGGLYLAGPGILDAGFEGSSTLVVIASVLSCGLFIKSIVETQQDIKKFYDDKEIYQQLKIAATAQKELAAGQLSLEEKVQGELSLGEEGEVSLYQQ